MEVKPGYKQTEVGIIPEEWQLFTLKEVCERISVGLATSVTQHYRDSGIPIIRNLNIKDGFFDGRDMLFITEVFAKANSSKAARAFDVLTVHTGANLGDTCVLPAEFDNCQTFTTLITTPNPTLLNPYFLCIHMGSFTGKKELARLQVGGGKGNLNTGDLKNYRVIVPSLPEQRAIAEALSDVDELLVALDRLIAKQRDLKQATMQQLLTGQTRLPGFTGEWEVKRLGDVVDTDPENLGSDTRPDFTFNYISLEDVDRGALRSNTEQVFATAPSRARRKLRPNDVLVSTVRPNLQSHLLFRSGGGNWVCSTGFCVVRCRQGITHPTYVFSHLFASFVNRQIEALLTGSNYPAINSRDVRALQIPLPNFDEQIAIATVLADMDAELTALEQRRDKTRLLKQAMMQELLTGRTRLVG
jgi:type I restriction enzyme S subunit